MGASGWAYFVPYQVDINQALQNLRGSVFHSGEYFTEANFLAMVIEKTQDRMPPETLRRFLDRLARLKKKARPSTIQELMRVNGENGTHSIIDIEGISEISEFGKVAPLSSQQLMQLFGTEKPTREMVEMKIGEIQDLFTRWEGGFFTVFQNGLPSEICFVGVSGD
jgi:hypothetical protein